MRLHIIGFCSRLWLIALLVALAGPAVARPLGWVVPSLERVGPDAPARAERTIRLWAAHGETESFQIVLRAEGEPLTKGSVSVGDLTGPNGAVIPARNLALFREHFVEVRSPSPVRPGQAGWYADALLPFRDPLTGRAPKSATLKAQPFDVAAGASQPVWVDVSVPSDAVAGVYAGAWSAVSEEGRVGGRIELTVWGFALPAQPTLHTSFNQWSDHSLAADEVLVGHKVMPLWIDPAGARKLAGQGVLGSAGLGFWSGAEAGRCGLGRAPSVAEISQRAAAFPKGLLLYNFTAEDVSACPNAAPGLREWTRALHSAGVASMVRIAPDSALDADKARNKEAAVDIWAVDAAAYHAAEEPTRDAIAKGAQVWGTTTLAEDPAAPLWLLDQPPASFRVLPGYLAQSVGLTGITYWAVDYWRNDPYADVIYHDDAGGSFPGAGVLVYPGGPAGVAGVVPSIRLKRIRDGVEDYDLLALARARGLPDLDKEIAAIGGRSWSGWNQDPTALEASRRRIGDALSER